MNFRFEVISLFFTVFKTNSLKYLVIREEEI